MMLAGGAGALLRFVGDGFIRTWLGRTFPWGTLIINVSGSFLLGLVTALVLHGHTSETIELIIGMGFCGGYTTFSTASFETVRLIEEQRYSAAIFNSLGTLSLALIAAAVGLGLGG
jgi:CrcB protein